MGSVEKAALQVGCLWILALICLVIMKKIQPDTFRLYLVYVIIICGGITWFVIWILGQYELL